jgi:predicted dithiol-disulfide oxidoreductase (DUF899 family)
MPSHPVVSQEEWIAARTALLEQEKAFTRERDALTRALRALPWRAVEKDYRFQGSDGPLGLADLFEGRSQLIVYHFMFDPEWDEGCKSCSLLADHYDPAVVHLNARDVSLVTVSRAPLDKLEAFKARMGWSFPWVSSHGSQFNRDFFVSFTDEECAGGQAYYNYRKTEFPMREAPGLSVFRRDADGGLYHTYSAYARGLDLFIGAYNFLDIVPKGRDEGDLSFSMEWVRHHDRYSHGGA